MPPALAGRSGPKILSVSVNGNAHISSDAILSQVQTHVGDTFEPRTLQTDLKSIFALGYFTDQVPPTIRRRPGGVAITFNVVENPVIKKINFEGDRAVPPETLLALMDSAVGQVLNTNTFHQDVLKINAYYDKIGYGGEVPTHVADLHIDGDTGTLDLKIVEGLTIRKLIIAQRPQADPVLSPAQIMSVLSQKTGDVYSEATREKDQEALKALYNKEDLQLGDFTGGIVPNSVDPKTGTADVVYNITAARVAAIQITGNSKTRDFVIRRQLRLHPGDLVTQSGLRRDYERLSNLGFFDRVDLIPKPGPDQTQPSTVVLDWNVKEGRTGTASIGAGYSGGLTGQGLTGNLGYSESNINGTGNVGSVRFERGALLSSVEVSGTIPYLGKTERSQKYSLSGALFFDSQTNYYPVYAYGSTTYQTPPTVFSGAPGRTSVTPGAQTEVQLIPNGQQIGGVVANYASRNNGVAATLGRRLSDYVTASAGVNVSRVATDVSLPAGFYFPQVGGGVTATASGTQALGITAPSLADLSSGSGYNLRSVTIGLGDDTRDDVFNPRRGYKAQLAQEKSVPGFGSDFHYGIVTLDAARFFPVGKLDTLGFHILYGSSTGAIPPSKLFTFSDQQLRGYNDVFYGTDAILLQTEARIPLTPDKHFGLAVFGETGGTRIRGAGTGVDSSGYFVNYGNYSFHGDAGVGVRFDIPQLGFRSIRLDYARGSRGSHTSFGIGQSF